jgi:hypothetical protein
MNSARVSVVTLASVSKRKGMASASSLVMCSSGSLDRNFLVKPWEILSRPLTPSSRMPAAFQSGRMA